MTDDGSDYVLYSHERWSDAQFDPVDPTPRYSGAAKGPGRWFTTGVGTVWTSAAGAAGILHPDLSDLDEDDEADDVEADRRWEQRAVWESALRQLHDAGHPAAAAFDALHHSIPDAGPVEAGDLTAIVTD